VIVNNVGLINIQTLELIMATIVIVDLLEIQPSLDHSRDVLSASSAVPHKQGKGNWLTLSQVVIAFGVYQIANAPPAP